MTANTNATLNGETLSVSVPEALIVRVRRQLLGQRRDTRVQVPGRAGSWVFSEEPGDRRIRIEIDIQGDSLADRRDAVRRLADWCDTPNGPVQLIIDDEPDRYHAVTLQDAPDPDEWLIRAAADLDYLADPYAFALLPSSVSRALSGSPDTETFNIADELPAFPVIEITPTNGTITAFTLTVNGYVLSWAGVIADDSTLTISSISSTVAAGVSTDVDLTGAFEPSSVQMSNVDGVFPLLVPGSNSVTLSWAGTATLVTVNATWRRRYR